MSYRFLSSSKLKMRHILVFLSAIAIATVARADEESSVSRSKRDVVKMSYDTKFKIATIHHLPYMNITQGFDGKPVFTGFLADLMSILGEIMKFNYEFYESPDNTYGSLKEDGSWTGLIGELIKRNENNQSTADPVGADLAAAPLTVSFVREQVVDFILPFHNLGLTVVAQKTYLKENITMTFPFDFSIFSPFAPAVWGLVTCAIVAVGLLLWLFNTINPYEWGGRYNLGLASNHQKDSFNCSGSLWFVFSTLQWQGFERAPRSIAAKVLTCFWFAFITLTLTSYIGSLVNQLWWSSMVHKQNPTKHPIIDLADLVGGKGNEFKYGCIRGGSTYTYITQSYASRQAEFAAMAQYWQTQEGSEQLVSNTKEGIAKARSEKYAFIMETMDARWLMNQAPCDLTTIGDQFALRSYGLALPEGSPHKKDFDAAILMLIEDGRLDFLEKRWWQGKGECWNYSFVERAMEKVTAMELNESRPKRITLSMFWGPLVAMGVGMLLSFLIAIAEIMYYRYKGRYLESNRPQSQTLKLDNEDGNI